LDHRGINENKDRSEATADVAAPTNGVISGVRINIRVGSNEILLGATKNKWWLPAFELVAARKPALTLPIDTSKNPSDARISFLN
jgi:hypothetical protein